MDPGVGDRERGDFYFIFIFIDLVWGQVWSAGEDDAYCSSSSTFSLGVTSPRDV